MTDTPAPAVRPRPRPAARRPPRPPAPPTTVNEEIEETSDATAFAETAPPEATPSAETPTPPEATPSAETPTPPEATCLGGGSARSDGPNCDGSAGTRDATGRSHGDTAALSAARPAFGGGSACRRLREPPRIRRPGSRSNRPRTSRGSCPTCTWWRRNSASRTSAGTRSKI